jgi:hypothetical protein
VNRAHPGARAGARFGIGVVVYLQLAAARGAWAQDTKVPVPWPTKPDEVIPYETPAVPPRGPSPTPVPTPAPSSSASSSSPSSPSTGTETAVPRGRKTHLGALGEGLVFIDRDRNANWDLRRLMAAFTHTPTAWLRFHAVAGIEHADRFAAQQAVIELAPAPAFAVRAGLLLLPLGIINQMNAPNTYLTVDRPLTDQLIIPTIWREVGAGIFGEVAGGLRYELDVLSGLDATGFSAQAPLAGGRGNGDGFGAGGLAFAGRLELFGLPEGFAMGGSGYYGSASGGQQLLDGVNVGIVEGDLRFSGGGFDLRVEYAQVFIFNSYRVNDYLGLLGQDAVAKTGRGAYMQAGYNVLRLGDVETRQELLFFAGYENVNPRRAMSAYNYNPPTITGPGETPPNAPSPDRSFAYGGIVYRPLPELAFKVDLVVALDGAGPPPTTPVPVAGAPGMPRPLEAELAQAARGRSRLGLAIGFAF